VLQVDPDRPDVAALDEATEVLRRGGLVAFPTETVYGLGADATNPDAISKVFEAKGRPATNPLIVHGDDVDAVRPAVSNWPKSAEALARTFWPGPLTLVLPRSGLVPDAVTAGQGTVGVRVPDHEVARRLLERVGRPVAAPSANRSTGVSPTHARHVLDDLDGKIDLILDAGPTSVGIESTVVDLTGETPRLLRPGAITPGQIGAALGCVIENAARQAASGAFSSPGQMEVHYAPRARVELIDAAMIGSFSCSRPDFRHALLVAGHVVPADLGVPIDRVDWLDPAQAARELYATLHRWDDELIDVILVILPPNEDAWLAVRDRLWRASRKWGRIP
jgi:L-threonylcarbamoyladenylate synthase